MLAYRPPPGLMWPLPCLKGPSLSQYSLADLGWTADFADQITDEDAGHPPARLTSVHRARVEGLGEAGPITLFLRPDMPMADLAVGDWVLHDLSRVTRILDRHSLMQRRAAGSGAERQLIAANLDTLFIVTSCNNDFNIGRLERFMILATTSEVEAVIVLTKADMCADVDSYIAQAKTLAPDLAVVALNAREPDAVAALAPWCGPGRTVALLGSSGVGKSTIANGLGTSIQDTGGIREDDAKGRHTTTRRNMLALPGGGWLIDTPGMRELQLTDAESGIAALFGDLVALAGDCRFRNCTHAHEPGCAVQAGIAAGVVDAARVARWQKLGVEAGSNTQTLKQAKAKAQALGKAHRKGKRVE